MTKYIITDEMIKQWRKNCVNLQNPHTNNDFCKACLYRGKGTRKGCCDFDDNHMEDIFRSRLLSAELKDEREKYEPILEHVIALCDEIIEKHDPQSRWGFNALLIKRKIESLRGEP